MKNIRVAGVQAAPVFMDLERTVDKTCCFIAEAAREGAQVVAFPEAYIPGYPTWIWDTAPTERTDLFKKLYQNAIRIPGEAVLKISKAARNNNIYVCVSVTELDGGSLYLTQLWFDNKGNLIGKHRKLKPTAAERLIWGQGDGSMMSVYDTEIGRLGGLMCWEHMLPLNIAAMNSMNEQIHVAAWPGLGVNSHSLLSRGPGETATRYYSAAAQCFTIMSTQVNTEESIQQKQEVIGTSFPETPGGGCARIYNPIGEIISNVLPDDVEGIVYGELDLDLLIEAKYLLDPAGHYSTPDVLSLKFNQNPLKSVERTGVERNTGLTYEILTESIIDLD
ncbi:MULTISPECIES: carbon-nitrogen hydrolase family protein [unclassified Paenibacillus]|uniref:carbon-nitrogen hydrolase family protein n=1 Tax=unclassified Paenibacillus TaxID=185978 RepID=UPI0024058315|nr:MULTISPECIES: carbon-nitrogen hydrolase family protein [unclassified Paenibacillus]MDF9839523.1 putative amidohydrolase [Paenibacillus sp. PastF-2]MDF9846104.1 putative amidohydrolase [Paenibacillus sp. PastM-2]MDF9852677.1 putative amidohydrolase [Paenibacillus sp. PastF-1]MDH6477592.1 putative amidohydrolase [Paenibacillus sp. PastH-2]MDH6505335.1 putative amidohydrolase [Paenibacillus sp. PastM-3]